MIRALRNRCFDPPQSSNVAARCAGWVSPRSPAGALIPRSAWAAGASAPSGMIQNRIWCDRARRIDPDEQQAILSALVAKEIADERNEQHGFRMALAKMESRLNQMEAALARAASAGDVETIFI